MRIGFENRGPGGDRVIRLRRSGDRIELTFESFEGEDDVRFTSPGTTSDIRALIADLRAKAGSRRFCPKNYDGLGDARVPLVQELGVLGHRLFEALFCPAAADLLRSMLDGSSSAKAVGGPPVIVVRHETLSVPLELLRQTSVDFEDRAPWNAFLGCAALFVSRAARDASASTSDEGLDGGLGALVADDVFGMLAYDNEHVMIGHAYDDLLESFIDPNGARWYDVHAPRIVFDTLEPLDGQASARDAMQGRIVRFVQGRHDVLHLDADARYEASEASTSTTIRLSSDYKAHYRDVADWRLRGKVNTLVVLNFCDAATSVWDHDSLARRFQCNGGRAVVGTTSPICDGFAGGFMTALYGRLLDGTPVGRALHATRVDILALTSNPSALYYSLHGAPGLVLHTMDDPA